MEVVILAGGIGRRFGGAKQLAPVSPGGATLLDACHAGCRHAVVVTAPEMADAMRSLFDQRPITDLAVTVAIQDPDDLPAPRTAAPARRQRPWGTAHALWAARHDVTGPFLLFNADDYYGPGAPAARAAGGDWPAPSTSRLTTPIHSAKDSSGDLVRSAVSGRPEDEPQLDLIVVHRHRFEDLATGYLEGAACWPRSCASKRTCAGSRRSFETRNQLFSHVV